MSRKFYNILCNTIQEQSEFSGRLDLKEKTLKEFYSSNIKNTENGKQNQDNILKIADEIRQCRLCKLCENRKNTVPGEGNPNADLMFIGEAPGYNEDAQGKPFVGKAGRLLDKMLSAMKFSRNEIFIANVLKCRPPMNRNPGPEEVEKCIKYLNRQIDLIKPRVIVLLGSIPLKFLTDKKSISKERGKWIDYRGIKTMPTFHPAYLLRNPKSKLMVWNDLKAVMQVFKKIPDPEYR